MFTDETIFTEVRLKVPTHSVQVTRENIEDIRKYFNGEIENGMLRFEVSGHPWIALIDDWILMYYTGDVQVYTNKYFNRLYEKVPTTS